ncbi:Potassium-transporting ATPase B chain [Mycobacteroides abscessus subsp. abscessus]|nr:Potassium-transporting ATPase B chain [Mycobacteroides abscessus subsp. abscessus]
MSKSKNAVVTTGVFDPAQLIKALPLAVRKLDPRHMARNPVMFVVTVGSVATTVARCSRCLPPAPLRGRWMPRMTASPPRAAER